MLESELSDRGLRVDWNHRLVELELPPDGPVARIERLERDDRRRPASRTGTPARELTTLAPTLVMGTDGYRSTVRRILGASFEPMSEPESYAVFEFTSSAPSSPEGTLVLEDRLMSACWPMAGGKRRWSFQVDGVEPFQRARVKSRLFANVGEQLFPQLDDALLGELAVQRAPWMRCVPDELLWSIAIRFERKLASRWGAGRAWLAGDAAHVAHPAGAHSMNVGFLEVRDLAERMAAVVKHGRSTDVLAAYGEQRDRDWRRLLGAVPVRVGPDATTWVRRHAGRILHGIPAAGEHLAGALAQLGLTWG